MAITEIVVPNFKQDSESQTTWLTEVKPFLENLLANYTAPPKSHNFGKILLENGVDVSGDFRPFLGLEWHQAEDFFSIVSSPGFASFGALATPLALAKPNPQLYETDAGPCEVFGSALTEVWQVEIGDGLEKEQEVREAWGKLVDAVGMKGIQGSSLNQDGKLWIGVIGWEGFEARERVLRSATVKEVKNCLDGLVWNTFVGTFVQ